MFKDHPAPYCLMVAIIIPLVTMMFMPPFAVAEEDGPSFSFYGYPHQPWKFHHEQGFNFNEVWIGGNVKDGKFNRCQVSRSGNRYSNHGELVGDYDQAEIKILFFGSSYTATEMTNQVQAMLSEKLGRSVCILNFWRDSAGFQNNFDIAANVAAEFKPDLILVANNTLGYAFPRIWRPIIPQGNRFWHWYQSRTPDPLNIDPKRAYLQPFVLTDLVTKEWAAKMSAAKENGDEKMLREDPVILEMIAEYHRIMKIKQAMVEKHGQPVMSVQLDDWTQDRQLVNAVGSIRELGIPFQVIHVQTLPEFRLGKGGYLFNGMSMHDHQGIARSESFEKVIWKKVIHLIDYYEPDDLADPVKLMTTEKNWHPSEFGREAMARAITNLVVQNKDTWLAGNTIKKTDAIKDPAIQLGSWTGNIWLPFSINLLKMVPRKAPERYYYFWFYEHTMFDALEKGTCIFHGHKPTQIMTSENDSRAGITLIDDASIRLGCESVEDGVNLTLTVSNDTDQTWPELSAIMPCLTPGSPDPRNPEPKINRLFRDMERIRTWYLGPEGLKRLTDVRSDLHFNHDLRPQVDQVLQETGKGQDQFPTRGFPTGDPEEWPVSADESSEAYWPISGDNAHAGLILRESDDGDWIAGIAWDDYLSVSGHYPLRCMHLSARVGPLAPGQTKVIRGKIYLFRGTREEGLSKFRKDFGPDSME
jgi:hypothetical protein